MEKSRLIRKLKEIFSDQRGMAAVFAILVLLLISLWGAATLTLSTNEYHISNSSKKAVQAYYLAEAGIEEAISNLKKGEDSFDGQTVNLENGTYMATITSGSIPENGTETIEVESLGISENAKRTLTTKVELTKSTAPPTYENSLPDYRELGDLNIGNHNSITGNIFAGENLNAGTWNNFTGDIYIGGLGQSEFHTHTTITGNIFVEGDLRFRNDTTIYGDIYIKGNLRLPNNHFYHYGNIYYDWDSTSGSGGFSLQINELF